MRHAALISAIALLCSVELAFAQDYILPSPSASWVVTGNRNTSPSNFLGTLSDEPLIFKADDSEAMRILPNGNIGIGTANPSGRLGVISCSEAFSGPDTSIAVFGGSCSGNGVYGNTTAHEYAGVLGSDTSSGGGYGVYGTSNFGLAAEFFGGASGAGFCAYSGGPGWTCSSDRNLKDDFTPVDTAALLERLDGMPVFTYRFKNARDHALYLGVTAQDFAAAFHLGNGDDTTINTANIEGVAVAAAKGLYEKLKQDESRIATLEQQLADQTASLQALKDDLARLEKKTDRSAAARPPRKTRLSQR
jgi:trimeric autotransporter adhesin